MNLVLELIRRLLLLPGLVSCHQQCVNAGVIDGGRLRKVVEEEEEKEEKEEKETVVSFRLLTGLHLS